MKRKIDLQTKLLWITYLILSFWIKENLICDLLPTFVFFTVKAFVHLFFGMINEVEMLEIKNKCSSKNDWIVFTFYLAERLSGIQDKRSYPKYNVILSTTYNSLYSKDLLLQS